MADFDALTQKKLGRARAGRLARVVDEKPDRAAEPAKTKVVFIHGFAKGPKGYRRLIRLLMDTETTRGRGDVFVFHFRSWWGDAETTARGLARELTRLLESDPGASLVLVGHSLGGALARRAILLLIGGWEAGTDGPAQRPRPELYSRLDRLVLLSSTNRGFEPKAVWQGLSRRVLELVGWKSPIFDVIRGSKWIANLRVEWIETFGGVEINPDPPADPREDRGVVVPRPEGTMVPPHPRTIQIDGARDRIVRPDDSADLALFKESVRQYVVRGIIHFDFLLKDLPRHAEAAGGDRTAVIPIAVGSQELPEGALSPDAGERAHERQLAALADLIAAAASGQIDPAPAPTPGVGFGLKPPGPYRPLGPSPGGWWAGKRGGPATYDIVFMIHGIRDYGSWHPILGEALEHEIERATGYWKIVPIEYGYFSALQFLIPIQQQRLVKGFTDRYLNELTRALRAMLDRGEFTRIRLHAATHSNGCNVLGQAIMANDRITFSRVFHAGCVLPRNFWGRADNSAAAVAVRNDCATLDWPVGVLCAALGRLPIPAYRFLGPAGVRGFSGPGAARAGERRFVQNNLSFVGDHGAALEPARMASIASYLVSDNRIPPPLDGKCPGRMLGPRLALGAGVLGVVGGFGWLLYQLALVGGLWTAGLGLAAILATGFVIAMLLNI